MKHQNQSASFGFMIFDYDVSFYPVDPAFMVFALDFNEVRYSLILEHA